METKYFSEKVGEVLNRLPEPYREIALNQVYDPEIVISYPQGNTEGLIQAKAIFFGFPWVETNEGYDYWRNAYDALNEIGSEELLNKLNNDQ